MTDPSTFLAHLLTNQVEQSQKLYRTPLFWSLALSMRAHPDDRFLITDNRQEDARRGVRKLSGTVQIQRDMTKGELGVDSRQFVDMSGLLLFKGESQGDQVVPYGNVSNVGGLRDSEFTLWASTGTAQQKEDKLLRFGKRRPDDVIWRVRTPIMMASQTSVIDYLAMRVTHLEWLHSVAIKWSDRRWNAFDVPISGDMYRPENERSDMIILAPVWMDEDMEILDPNIWGPLEDVVQMNYMEYIGRQDDFYREELEEFIEIFNGYRKTLQVNIDSDPPTLTTRSVGRVQRDQGSRVNRTLIIPFNRNIESTDDSYQSLAFDPNESVDVTQDIFNSKNVDGSYRFTSSFEADTLTNDGWKVSGTASLSTDVPEDLPPFVDDVQGTQSLRLTSGYAVRRMVLPDGDFILRFWHKATSGRGRIEVVRNTRLIESQSLLDFDTSRVEDIRHFRSNYETVAHSIIHPTPPDPIDGPQWEEFHISFKLKDHFFVSNEGYPAHEVFIVFSEVETDEVTDLGFDHINLLLDQTGTSIEIINTSGTTRFPNLLREQERQLNYEKIFGDDTYFPISEQWEKASAKFRFDGENTCAVVEHRESFNLKPTGTNINFWFKVNSEDEEREQVLLRRGSFVLCQKTGVFFPSYQMLVNDRRQLVLTTYEGNTRGNITSTEFRNLNLHTLAYERYRLIFSITGKQPRHWFDGDASTTIETFAQDFYLILGGRSEMEDTTTGLTVTAWKYYEWHARRAYGVLVPEEDLEKHESFGAYAAEYKNGNTFLKVPINDDLINLPGYYGNYIPSPAEYSPRLLPSPGAESPEILQWPIDLTAFGPEYEWPTSPAYGASPEYIDWYAGTRAGDIQMPLLAFADGAMTFDRWFNLDFNASQDLIEVRLQGELLTTGGGGTFNVTGDRQNEDNLEIATSNPDDTNTCSPISMFSFKITQRFLPEDAIKDQFQTEAINFNEVLYLIFKDYIDFNGDKVLDLWQSDQTDIGLELQWVDEPPEDDEDLIRREFDQRLVYPDEVGKFFGRVKVSVPDPILMTSRPDRDLSILADTFDDPYMNELVDIQTIGYSDGLLFWDFLADGNDEFYSVTIDVWDEECRKIIPKNLSYSAWLLELIGAEYNTVRAVTDTIPALSTFSPEVSPQSDYQEQWPTYGDDTDELVMTGVKGWFGFDDLLGYRDSLERVYREGVIGNYFQVEFRFRADRVKLDSMLEDFAQSYEQLFNNDFERRKLR